MAECRRDEKWAGESNRMIGGLFKNKQGGKWRKKDVGEKQIGSVEKEIFT